jgi:hypothetical protein
MQTPLSLFFNASHFAPSPERANQQQGAQARRLSACVWCRGAEAPGFGGAAALPMERERAKPLEGRAVAAHVGCCDVCVGLWLAVEYRVP